MILQADNYVNARLTGAMICKNSIDT